MYLVVLILHDLSSFVYDNLKKVKRYSGWYLDFSTQHYFEKSLSMKYKNYLNMVDSCTIYDCWVYDLSICDVYIQSMET